jgi:hypothetical protein
VVTRRKKLRAEASFAKELDVYLGSAGRGNPAAEQEEEEEEHEQQHQQQSQ